MFVKVIEKGRESVFECTRYSLWELGADEKNPNKKSSVMIEIRGIDNRDLEVLKNATTEVYILNDAGKTIDKYRWES